MDSNEGKRAVARRTLLLGGLGMVATPWLAGCASRVPPPPPKPFSLLALLPVAMAPGKSNQGFGGTYTYVATPGVPAGPALAGNLIGALIVVGMESKRRSDREAMQRALAAVAFDPTAAVQKHVAAALEQRGVRTVTIDDAQLARAVRNGHVDGLPAGVDAVLDITIEESGFYDSTRAGGLSPMLNLWASLREAAPGAEELAGSTYYADWREGGKDRRWVTTPKSMIFADTDVLANRGAEAREGLEIMALQLANLMADDLQRHAQGLPPLV